MSPIVTPDMDRLNCYEGLRYKDQIVEERRL